VSETDKPAGKATGNPLKTVLKVGIRRGKRGDRGGWGGGEPGPGRQRNFCAEKAGGGGGTGEKLCQISREQNWGEYKAGGVLFWVGRRLGGQTRKVEKNASPSQLPAEQRGSRSKKGNGPPEGKREISTPKKKRIRTNLGGGIKGTLVTKPQDHGKKTRGGALTDAERHNQNGGTRRG